MPLIRLIIELQDGKLNVNGPIHDKTLCYGLLESAKDAIRDYVAENQSPILKPHIMFPKSSDGGTDA